MSHYANGGVSGHAHRDNCEIVDMSDGFDFSKQSDQDYADSHIAELPRLAILHARPGVKNSAAVRLRARQHKKVVVELAVQQSYSGLGFLFVSPERGEVSELLDLEDCVFIPPREL